jgi:hypothetical protein
MMKGENTANLKGELHVSNQFGYRLDSCWRTAMGRQYVYTNGPEDQNHHEHRSGDRGRALAA